MIEKNFIKLLSWSVYNDNFGSDYKIINKEINDNMIIVKLKKSKQFKNNHTYITIKFYLDNSFNDKYFKIPGSKGFSITYKNTNNNEILFCIEQDYNKYFYYVLLPSKEWKTKTIKINRLKNDNNEKLDLNNITGFTFSLNSYFKNEILDTLFIKEFFIENYEIVLKNTKDIVSEKFIMKKNILNNLKSFFLKNKIKKYKLLKSKGKPFYCISPFFMFNIDVYYCSVCCWLYIDENVDFNKNKSLLDVWYSDKFDKIRKSIKYLSYSECDLSICAELYPNINTDYIKSLSEIKNEYPEIADYLEGKTEKFKGLPKYIMAGFDSTCNLTCRSCNVNLHTKLPKTTGKKYIKQIEEIGGDLEILQITSFGDPFASPVCREWLFNFNDKKFSKLKKIIIMTNGILWTEENWDKVSDNVKKKCIDGIISIDGATKETYEYNRNGAKFETLIKNLEFISKLRKKNEIKKIILYFVIQQNNYKEIPLIINFAKQYLFDLINFKQIRNWGTYTKDEFDSINIFDKKHPEYKYFKKIYLKINASANIGINVKFRFKL